MKSVFVFGLLLSLAFASSPRTKRSPWQFQRMIHCLTDRSALLDYNAYGCWCGLGGRGIPVDETDRCCRTHDRCYDRLKNSGDCRSWELYIKSYSYSTKNCDTKDASVTCVWGSFMPEYNGKCFHSSPSDRGYFGKGWAGDCSNPPNLPGYERKGDECQRGLCECDMEAAKCFRRSEFNSRYRYWSNRKC